VPVDNDSLLPQIHHMTRFTYPPAAPFFFFIPLSTGGGILAGQPSGFFVSGDWIFSILTDFSARESIPMRHIPHFPSKESNLGQEKLHLPPSFLQKVLRSIGDSAFDHGVLSTGRLTLPTVDSEPYPRFLL